LGILREGAGFIATEIRNPTAMHAARMKPFVPRCIARPFTNALAEGATFDRKKDFGRLL
jgi:hypothetical protein